MLKIIMGSTRDGRAGQAVMEWVQRRAESRGDFDVELLDLRDWKLPMFAETLATVGDFSNPTYSELIVRDWNRTIADGDAVIFITPEYNHSFSGEIKNAIDNVFASYALRNKPAGMIAYSGGPVSGARAVEQLALVLLEAEMVPIRNSVLVANVNAAFGENGEPTSRLSDIALTVMLEDLAWWTRVTHHARGEGMLKPGNQRFREMFDDMG
jgi:NAD(P)H-dependent FMN reductase